MKRAVGFIAVVLLLLSGESFAGEYSLRDLFALALERAERVKVSEEELFYARRQAERARSAFLPRVSAFGEFRKYTENEANGALLQPDSTTSYGLRLDLSFSLGGREIEAFRIARAGIVKSGEDLRAEKEGYLFGVAGSYYNVLRARRAYDISLSNVERLRRHREAALARVNVGEATKTVLLRAEAELSAAAAELARAENNVSLSKAVLGRTAGIIGDYEIKDPGPFEGPLPEGCALDCLKETARAERPELKSLGLAKEMAERQVGFAKGAYWPTLSVEGVYYKKEDDPASALSATESIYGGVKLNFVVWDGGLRKAEVGQARARMRQSGYALSDVGKSVDVAVEAAYLDLLTEERVLESLARQAAFARENYVAVSRQFEAGLATSLDVMDANTLLVSSERQLSEAELGYQLATLKALRETGTLLKKYLSTDREEEIKP